MISIVRSTWTFKNVNALNHSKSERTPIFHSCRNSTFSCVLLTSGIFKITTCHCARTHTCRTLIRNWKLHLVAISICLICGIYHWMEFPSDWHNNKGLTMAWSCAHMYTRTEHIAHSFVVWIRLKSITLQQLEQQTVSNVLDENKTISLFIAF